MPMIRIIRTNSDNPDFRKLVSLLDADLREKDGDEHAFFSQYNKIDMIGHVVMAYDDETAVGCGAFKKYDHETAEIKRMFVFPEHRGKGIAGKVLAMLEQWASEEGFSGCILETGKKMTDAIRLYQRKNYLLTENYGQYMGVESSVCMKKHLNP
jgi:putative acetyltransferase